MKKQRLGSVLAALGIGMANGGSVATLVERPDGGWDTHGLPYVARVSPHGHLESLQAGGFEFVAAPGIYLADKDEPIPFASARQVGDVLVASHARGELRIRFLPDSIAIVGGNRALASPDSLRLALAAGLARVKDADAGTEIALPLKNVSGRLRLLAPTGASLTLPRAARLTPRNGGFLAALPGLFPPGGGLSACAIEISSAPRVEDEVRLRVSFERPDHTSWDGAPLTFATAFSGVGAPFEGDALLRIKAYLTKETVRELRQPLSAPQNGESVLSWTLANLDPSLYEIEVGVEREGAFGICATPRAVFNANALLPPAPPVDFDDFWQRTLEEQAAIPRDLQWTRKEDVKGREVYTFSFAGLLGFRGYGYLVVPKDKSRRYPATLRLPPAGMRSQPLPDFGENRVGMTININTVPVDLPDAEYEWETWPPPYVTKGIMDRDRYTLRFSYAATVRAAEILAARPEVDPAQITVSGSSQGGGLVLVAAGLYPSFVRAEANVPALCRLDWNVRHLQPPFFPVAVSSREGSTAERTLAYFDAVHFARRVACPIRISIGLHDDITPSMGVFCAYNAIPGTNKTLVVNALKGH